MIVVNPRWSPESRLLRRILAHRIIRGIGFVLAGGCAFGFSGCATKIYDVKVSGIATRPS